MTTHDILILVAARALTPEQRAFVEACKAIDAKTGELIEEALLQGLSLVTVKAIMAAAIAKRKDQAAIVRAADGSLVTVPREEFETQWEVVK